MIFGLSSWVSIPSIRATYVSKFLVTVDSRYLSVNENAQIFSHLT